MTIQKNIHNSPRKLRLVADMVRKMSPGQALQALMFTNKVATEPLSKAIKTALSNAKQQNLDQESLVFKKIEINEASKMKRFRAGTKGRVKRYVKRMSHIKIVLSDDSNLKAKGSKVKSVKLEEKIEKGEENGTKN